MNLNKDPSSYAKIPPVLVATWAPSEVQDFVALAFQDIGAMAAEIETLRVQLADAEATLFKLNSGEELQSLMKLNNELRSQLVSEQWQPIETAPPDSNLLVGWWRTWPEREWACMVNYASNTKAGWRHGFATHWRPLPSGPALSDEVGKLICKNCSCPIEDADKDFCGMCREMGATHETKVGT